MLEVLKKEIDGVPYRRMISDYYLSFMEPYSSPGDRRAWVYCVTPWENRNQGKWAYCLCGTQLTEWHNCDSPCRCGIYWNPEWNYAKLLPQERITCAQILRVNETLGYDVKIKRLKKIPSYIREML